MSSTSKHAASKTGQHPADNHDWIRVQGARENNLKDVSVEIPKRRLTVFTGVSGSGKSSLVFGTIAAESQRLARLRDHLLAGLRARLPGVIVNGSLTHRLPNNLHVTFDGVDGATLLISIGDIAVSSGSACGSASEAPSHVLRAVLGDQVPSASIRFGLGRFTTDADIEYAIDRFATVVGHLQEQALGTGHRN